MALSGPTSHPAVGLSLPDRLRADLLRARRTRDDAWVSVIRTTLAALANAEAPPLETVVAEPSHGRLVEHPRLVLTHDDHQAIVRAELADREDTIARFEQGGATAEADALRHELALLRRYLD
jgi:uncharacterized protein YqeY